ncbi:MAG TPA: NADH:flavin oxidoreductase, partial [Fuerstia sp.]|nr:NADH:flavin oxidoreductase [Fuerstiella sp.]
VLAGKVMTRKKVCRTFSDCTTAPRNGMVSGCYPLDPFYKERPEWEQLKNAKQTG